MESNAALKGGAQDEEIKNEENSIMKRKDITEFMVGAVGGILVFCWILITTWVISLGQ